MIKWIEHKTNQLGWSCLLTQSDGAIRTEEDVASLEVSVDTTVGVQTF